MSQFQISSPFLSHKFLNSISSFKLWIPLSLIKKFLAHWIYMNSLEFQFMYKKTYIEFSIIEWNFPLIFFIRVRKNFQIPFSNYANSIESSIEFQIPSSFQLKFLENFLQQIFLNLKPQTFFHWVSSFDDGIFKNENWNRTKWTATKRKKSWNSRRKKKEEKKRKNEKL